MKKQRGIWKTACFLLVVAGVWPLQAATVDGLYEAEVAVTDEGPEVRQNGFREAFAKVIVKVTGSRGIAESGAAAPIIENARAYVQRFGYEERELPADEDNPFPGRQLYLQVRFDQNGVDRVLRNRGLPLWGRERPTTLVWLAVEEAGERAMVGAGHEDQRLLDAVSAAAAERGINLTLPLLDLEDRARLNVADIRGGFADRIIEASQRYSPYGILVGDLLSSGPGVREGEQPVWSARWTLIKQDGSMDWESVTSSVDSVVMAGVDGVADNYARQFALDTLFAESGRVEVLVRDINTLEDYARAVKYFESLSVVDMVDVARVAAGEVQFRLKLLGDLRNFEQAVALGRTLQAEHIEPVIHLGIEQETFQRPDILYFRLLP
ncbi:MAG: DUF2066 domain-containing protein [Gammaproteobacteria bacterium]|nr:DUF2066 domain-containing protein [Gammaproteobacteria bacterium]